VRALHEIARRCGLDSEDHRVQRALREASFLGAGDRSSPGRHVVIVDLERSREVALELREQGESLKAVAEHLGRLGLVARSGRPWTPRTVRSLLDG
jgi:hypothetical protein